MKKSCLEKNVGPIDRLVRLAIVAVLWIWPLTTAMSTVGTAIMSALGGIILVTAVTGYCLLYDVLNWSTVRRHSHA
ncbi:MAG: DUF2892 domain-containing protein [Sulfobacillus thermosulfidooxidans]|uniref:Inner membrane protein YgaP-like transmembrane domain-containing protein n=1 Tax=Sulfobacillus thermotolerans TaxID=338644 RepID=A0ABN5H1B7_9FIRM|nr:DUF2892 domain-containing protein [Sulfobacillus sp. hq2]AUW93398.1 hypothetical protein BXT84_05045 [Sulfobacillus thermotolerans]MCY0906968.1 DUF2892 domain-containing protein [Sulfobacillus thermotolerans]POB10629.1 hypothetical protein CO251_07285 [Sulfobacillus sp. hq2]PSR33481.1 MAG: DUF2892 domain-containing protein [Sulfobacillus thermosulfidooxidans]